MLGYSYRNLKQYDLAFKHYQRAIELDPRHRGAHEYIGETYLLTGDLAGAEKHLAALKDICLLPCDELKDLRARDRRVSRQEIVESFARLAEIAERNWVQFCQLLAAAKLDGRLQAIWSAGQNRESRVASPLAGPRSPSRAHARARNPALARQRLLPP
jgi:tetratricopeptide (TPR) repeat protein